jgi:hypothetical protein
LDLIVAMPLCDKAELLDMIQQNKEQLVAWYLDSGEDLFPKLNQSDNVKKLIEG